MVRHRVPLLVALAGASCSSDYSTTIVVPEDPDAESVLVVFERLGEVAGCGEVLENEAREADDATGDLFGLTDEGQRVRVTVFRYERPLSALGIDPGEQDLGLPANANCIQPTSIVSAEVRGDEEPAWEAVREGEGPSECFCLPAVECTVDFEKAGQAVDLTDPLNGGVGGAPGFLQPLNDRQLLTATGVDEHFVIELDGEELRATRFPAPGVPGESILPMGNDEYWLGGPGGALVRARYVDEESPRLVITASASVPLDPADELQWMVQAEPNGPIHLLSLDGRLFSWENDVFDEIAQVDAQQGLSSCGDMIATSTGEILAVRGGGPNVTTVVDGVARKVDLTGMLANAGCALAEVGNLGIVLGGSRGEFLVRSLEGGPWTEVERGEDNNRVHSIVPYDDGFVYTGQLKVFGQYQRKPNRVCDPVALTDNEGYYSVRLGDDVISVGTWPFPGIPSNVSRVRPK